MLATRRMLDGAGRQRVRRSWGRVALVVVTCGCSLACGSALGWEAGLLVPAAALWLAARAPLA